MNDATILLMTLRSCKRCEGKHMIITDHGPTAWGGYYEQFGPCPDCLEKVKEFAGKISDLSTDHPEPAR